MEQSTRKALAWTAGVIVLGWWTLGRVDPGPRIGEFEARDVFRTLEGERSQTIGESQEVWTLLEVAPIAVHGSTYEAVSDPGIPDATTGRPAWLAPAEQDFGEAWCGLFEVIVRPTEADSWAELSQPFARCYWLSRVGVRDHPTDPEQTLILQLDEAWVDELREIGTVPDWYSPDEPYQDPAYPVGGEFGPDPYYPEPYVPEPPLDF